MKKFFSTLLCTAAIATAITVSSCNKKAEIQTVTYNVTSDEICVDFWSAPYTAESTSEITPVNVQNAFLTAGITYDPSKVQTAKLNSLRATVTNGELSDITKIEVYIKVQGAAGSGLRIAHYDGGSTGSIGTSVALVLDGVELKQFLAAGIVSEVTIYATNKASAGDYTCLNINAGAIKADVEK